MTFGEWVRGKRKDLGQTRDQASDAIGVCASTLKNWENDRTHPRTIDKLRSLLVWSKEGKEFYERFLK